jgi:hypothetical protein
MVAIVNGIQHKKGLCVCGEEKELWETRREERGERMEAGKLVCSRERIDFRIRKLYMNEKKLACDVSAFVGLYE